MKLRVLDLFSGIGGFSLGLERTGGFETVAFCEIEDYPRRVLAKHWPGVPIYDDVRTLTADTLRRDGIAVDVICGGFPCQDLSFAGRRAGLEGARSGLWSEYARLIGELRPRYVLVENVPGLLSLGMGAVLGDLAALGYDATWDCIPAAAVGAPHRRDRVWLVAYAVSDERSFRGVGRPVEKGRSRFRCVDENAAHPDRQGQHDGPVHAEVGSAPQPVPDADDTGLEGRDGDLVRECPRQWAARSCGSLLHADGAGSHASTYTGVHRGKEGAGARHGESQRPDWWLSEPDVGRVAHGVPSRVDRLKGLGNAVVPQIPELIGRAILKAEGIA
jgi:DNA (cytosine-5)-methyltransferase 1